MKHLSVTNIYRSPSLINGLPTNEQMENFHDNFDDLLSKLSNRNTDAYLFLDSNINLFNLDTDICTGLNLFR